MRIRIIICGIMVAIVTLILAGYANDQQALETETKLKQTKITLSFVELRIVDIMKIVTYKAKCGLSFQIENDGGRDGIVPAINITQNININILKTTDNIYVEKIAVSNVTAFDLIDAVVNKAELKWRISGTGVVVVIPSNSIYLNIKNDYEERMDWEKNYGRPKPLSTNQVKSYVCPTNHTSVISDNNNYYVLASPWIEQPRGERPTYIVFKDTNGVNHFYLSIYIVPASLPSNINEMFNGPDAGASALRVSPRGEVGSPVWDRSGERIAYGRVSEDKKEGHIVILNVKNGRETVYSGLGIRPVPAYLPEISWDESGRLIAFKDAKDTICLLDLKDQTYRNVWPGNVMPASVSLSPDGNYVCFIDDFSQVVPNSQSLSISCRGQKVQEPEGSSPVLCVETNIGDWDKWTMNIVNIQKEEIKSISRKKNNIGILRPPLLWMPDSKSIVMRTFAPDEKGKCVPSYYLYRVAEKKLEPYSGDQKLPYCQSLRYWGVKGVQGDSVIKKPSYDGDKKGE